MTVENIKMETGKKKIALRNDSITSRISISKNGASKPRLVSYYGIIMAV